MGQDRLTWAEVAKIFDRSGSLYVGHRYRKGNRYRLRFSSYNKLLLNRLRDLFDTGSLYSEARKRGDYYRFEVSSREATLEALERMLPFLERKGRMAEAWIRDWG